MHRCNEAYIIARWTYTSVRMKNCPAFRVSLTAIDTYARIRVNPVTPLCKIGACFNDYFSGNRCTRSCSLRILHTPPINFLQKEIASIECHERRRNIYRIIISCRIEACSKTICLLFSWRIIIVPADIKSKSNKGGNSSSFQQVILSPRT